MTNVDQAEIDKFSRLAATWWDPDGEMAPLHIINPVRLQYVNKRAALKNLQVLDVGCGGGLLTEAMAQAGAHASGIDLAEDSLAVARQHAQDNDLSIHYQAIEVEQLAQQQAASFDVVTCMEMLEHVPDPASVIQACAALAKPGGDVFFSTLNRNPKSYALSILGAEYLLGLLPRGTHDYAKFIKPSELERWSRQAGLQLVDVSGLIYNPILKHARLGRDVDVNYLMHCRRPA
ncbi:MAG: bifunctional 2-polyprenyl-6-hydroxyphenol methylase/3-demethylubiquinol 3-O-methyltransferase UbiG [Nevskiales bacterium]